MLTMGPEEEEDDDPSHPKKFRFEFVWVNKNLCGRDGRTMRPSVRAEKYIRDASGAEKT